MEKRGQVSVFIIIGLVVIIVIALLFFFRSKGLESESKSINIEKRLEIEMSSIEKEIQECVNKESIAVIKDFVEAGGYPGNRKTITYHAKPITVLCQNIPGKDNCLQTPLLKTDLQNRINQALEPRIKTCLDLSPFAKKDYTLTLGNFQSTTEIHDKLIVISVEYPVTVEKQTVKFTKSKFDTKVNYPLGDLIKGVNEILDMEASFGKLDPVSYALLHVNKYLLIVNKPYPDKIYDLSLTKNPSIRMMFAVEGESKFK